MFDCFDRMCKAEEEMADLYKNNPDQFNAIARQWTSMYAIPL